MISNYHFLQDITFQKNCHTLRVFPFGNTCHCLKCQQQGVYSYSEFLEPRR